MADLLHTKDQDINDLRSTGIKLVEKFRASKVYLPKLKDLKWFKEEWEVYFEVPVPECDEFILNNYEEYNKHYPFLMTEWFLEWYELHMDFVRYTLKGGEGFDWRLFFSLAYPLPETLTIPFYRMVKRLNVRQLVDVKREIVEDIWKNPDLRQRVFKGEIIPSIFTYYMPYQQIRTRIVARARTDLDNRDAPYVKAFRKIFQTYKEDINQMRREGKTGEEISQWVLSKISS